MTAGWHTPISLMGGRSGTGFRDGIWHALGEPYPALASSSEPQPGGMPSGGPAGTSARWTLCGLVADVVRKAGVFDPDRYHACPTCGWWDAIRTDAIPGRVARLADGLRRGLAVALAEAIVAEAGGPGGDGVDTPRTVELLAAVSAHAGQALVDEACAEAECEHPDRADCPVTVVACAACSVICGGWAGEWEGRYRPEATVTTPCSVLTTLADHYRIGAGLFEHAHLAGTLTTPTVGDAR
jgi:hypothetical protein